MQQIFWLPLVWNIVLQCPLHCWSSWIIFKDIMNNLLNHHIFEVLLVSWSILHLRDLIFNSQSIICQKMYQPSVSDFQVFKRILRYIKRTVNHRFSISAETHSTLVCYSDSDWIGCKDTRRSTSGLCTFHGSNIISWSAKRHETVSKSSLMQNIEQYLVMGLGQKITPLFLCVNLSAVCLSANPMFYKRTKHFEVDYHYVRERVSMKKLEVGHIPASLQIADVFTKSLVVVWQTRCLATSDT